MKKRIYRHIGNLSWPRPSHAPTKMPHCAKHLRDRFLISVRGLSVLFLLSHTAPGKAEVLDLGTFTDIAVRCGSTVATLTLAAIAKTESRFQTLVVADNTTHISRIYQSKEEAASVAQKLIARGDSVDLGLMQINSANFKRLGMSVRDAFDPCKAVRAASSIMTKNFLASKRTENQQIALRNALSMYNTGNQTRGYRNGYVRRVEIAANSLAIHFTKTSTPTRPASDQPATTVTRALYTESWDVWHSSKNRNPTYSSEEYKYDVNVL